MQNSIVSTWTDLKRKSPVTVNTYIVCFSFFLFCVSELYLALGEAVSIQLKIIGCCLLILNMLTASKFDRVAFLLAPIAIIFLLNYYRSYSSSAAIEELLRFFLPIVILLNLYKNRKELEAIAYVFILIVVSNDIYQIYSYFAFMANLPVLFPPRFEAGYIVRAQGWVGFFSLFGFMNFCAFVLVLHTPILEKYKKALSVFFMIFAILSLSVKAVVAILVYFAITAKGKSTAKLTVLTIAAFSIFLLSQPKITSDIVSIVDAKLAFYVFQGNSARSDSYRVMFESLGQPNLLGEGLGSFGGPASIKYNSPLYSRYNFNWYGLKDQIATTDTLYPHLFVELGLLGGAIYLLFLFSYGQRKHTVPWKIIVISFLIDNLASFALLSAPYFFSAALCMMLFSKVERPNEN